MSKRISQLTQLTAAQLAQDDKIPIVDTSAGQTKYITTKDLTGLPDTGWIATGESWSFSSWNATTKIGVITVPTDATVKYNKGMWVRFSQTTGGTKYGYIVAVTSTTLTVNFFNLYTFTNETITSPVYSPLAQPIGSPSLPVVYTDAAGWKVIDYGRRKEWWNYVDKNVAVATGSRDAGTTMNVPTGIADMNNGTVRVTQTYNGNFASHATFGLQGNSCFIGNCYSGGPLTLAGRIHTHLILETEVY